MGDIQLSDMKATYYPPTLQPTFMGASPPIKNGYGSLYESGNLAHFQNYRNENLSKFTMPPYEWGFMNTPYTPRPDISITGKASNWNKILQMPRPKFSMLDAGRQQEVDDFYKAAQMHRDQYKDHTGQRHPLNYFKNAEYKYQCPSDPTSTYFKFPQYYAKYKTPPVLPLTLHRTNRMASLPGRALVGRFSPYSDISYKR